MLVAGGRMDSLQGFLNVQDTRRILEHHNTRTGELQLIEAEVAGKPHYELVMNGVFLMASYNVTSSQMLVDALVKGGGKHLELLIGGLGMGYTLRQALSYPFVDRVCVVELDARIVSWNRTYLGNAGLLDDPRTEVVIGDFCNYVQGNPRSYHGIILDIDNGPDWVVQTENRRVYSLSMLLTLQARLRSGGVMAIWGHAPSKPYERALREVFEDVSLQVASDVDPSGKSIESAIYVVQA